MGKGKRVCNAIYILVYAIHRNFGYNTSDIFSVPGGFNPYLMPKNRGTLVVIHWGDPKSFNPDSQVDDALFAIASQIYNKLVDSVIDMLKLYQA